MKVLQGRGLPLISAADVVPIDLGGAAVNDGLFLGRQLPGADELLTKRQQKLGLNPQVDYRSSAIGIMNMTPPESAVIASDIAVKSGNVYLGFADRFTGTLIITGEISDVMSAMTEVVDYFRDTLGYVVCKITKR